MWNWRHTGRLTVTISQITRGTRHYPRKQQSGELTPQIPDLRAETQQTGAYEELVLGR